MWANTADASRCPIAAYLAYAEMRPEGYSKPQDPFYLATNTRLTDVTESVEKNITWFKRQPIGQNKLSSIMPKMTEAAGIRRLTNHSARKHLVQKLNDAGVPPNQIMQVTGHKNIHSINNYSSLSLHQQKNISDIISERQTMTDITNEPHPSTSKQTNTTITKDQNVPSVAKDIFQNCHLHVGTMNINIGNNYNEPQQPPKRRRIINAIDSDSD